MPEKSHHEISIETEIIQVAKKHDKFEYICILINFNGLTYHPIELDHLKV